MNIDNQISRNAFGVNLLAKYVPYINGQEQADKFRKNGLATAPQRTVTNPNINPKVNNLYYPKFLLKAYTNRNFIESLVAQNPKIKEILKSKNIEFNVYPENINKIANSHLTTTTAYALQIANTMKLSSYDKKILEQACIFHDFGKILIPEELIEKKVPLTTAEKDKIDLHSVLGYELLSTSGMDKRVLHLVKNHHSANKSPDILCQVLSVADIYSALREERSYKKSLTSSEALSILDQKAKKGEVSTEVVDALKSSILAKTGIC